MQSHKFPALDPDHFQPYLKMEERIGIPTMEEMKQDFIRLAEGNEREYETCLKENRVNVGMYLYCASTNRKAAKNFQKEIEKRRTSLEELNSKRFPPAAQRTVFEMLGWWDDQ